MFIVRITKFRLPARRCAPIKGWCSLAEHKRAAWRFRHAGSVGGKTRLYFPARVFLPPKVGTLAVQCGQRSFPRRGMAAQFNIGTGKCRYLTPGLLQGGPQPPALSMIGLRHCLGSRAGSERSVGERLKSLSLAVNQRAAEERVRADEGELSDEATAVQSE
jgi:hypothetical protein